jgi:hypothetical protein
MIGLPATSTLRQIGQAICALPRFGIVCQRQSVFGGSGCALGTGPTVQVCP